MNEHLLWIHISQPSHWTALWTPRTAPLHRPQSALQFVQYQSLLPVSIFNKSSSFQITLISSIEKFHCSLLVRLMEQCYRVYVIMCQSISDKLSFENIYTKGINCSRGCYCCSKKKYCLIKLDICTMTTIKRLYASPVTMIMDIMAETPETD